MGWSGQYFEKQLKKFDPKLRVRLSHAGDCWLIERRCARGSAMALTPKHKRGPDAWQRDKDGYTYVTKDGSRSAHFEHTIAVTSKGIEILTKS